MTPGQKTLENGLAGLAPHGITSIFDRSILGKMRKRAGQTLITETPLFRYFRLEKIKNTFTKFNKHYETLDDNREMIFPFAVGGIRAVYIMENKR